MLFLNKVKPRKKEDKFATLYSEWCSYLRHGLEFQSENFSNFFELSFDKVSFSATVEEKEGVFLLAQGNDWIINSTIRFNSDYQRIEVPTKFINSVCEHLDIPKQETIGNLMRHLNHERTTTDDILKEWGPLLIGEGFEQGGDKRYYSLECSELGIQRIVFKFQRKNLLIYFHHCLESGLPPKVFLLNYSEGYIRIGILPLNVMSYFYDFTSSHLFFV